VEMLPIGRSNHYFLSRLPIHWVNQLNLCCI
jgi:hypothetical protein